MAVAIASRRYATASGGTFHANAVHFDGSTYLTKASTLIASGSSKGIFSAWIKPSAGDGAVRQLVKHTSTAQVKIFLSGIDRIDFILDNSSDVNLLTLANTTTDITSSSGWVHILASWDVSATYAKLLINGSDETSATTDTSGTINYPATGITYFSADTGASPFTGDAAEMYFNMAESIDLTVGGNVSKFISGGKPVSLGADGSTPTGTAPAVYLGNSASTWQNNLGMGGNFSVTGTVTAASTSPSD